MTRIKKLALVALVAVPATLAVAPAVARTAGTLGAQDPSDCYYKAVWNPTDGTFHCHDDGNTCHATCPQQQ